MKCKDRSGIIRIKKHEEEAKKWLKAAGLIWSYMNQELPCSPTLRFPDFVFITVGDWVVILEIDENEHRYYLQKCEIARISELVEGCDGKCLHVIRFNPHGKATKDQLIAAIREACTTNFGIMHDYGCAVEYLGYSENRVMSLDQLMCDMQVEKMAEFGEHKSE